MLCLDRIYMALNQNNLPMKEIHLPKFTHKENNLTLTRRTCTSVDKKNKRKTSPRNIDIIVSPVTFTHKNSSHPKHIEGDSQ